MLPGQEHDCRTGATYPRRGRFSLAFRRSSPNTWLVELVSDFAPLSGQFTICQPRAFEDALEALLTSCRLPAVQTPGGSLTVEFEAHSELLTHVYLTSSLGVRTLGLRRRQTEQFSANIEHLFGVIARNV